MTAPLTQVSLMYFAVHSNSSLSRQGAGAVYLNAHHPDIMRFLDTKRENADEKIRIKTLSLGVVIPDITFDLARKKEPMYLFSPYDVERVYGKPFGDISVNELYYEMVDDARIRKTKIDPRAFFQTLAEIQFESGYPFIMYEDTVNRAHVPEGRVNMSNLCQPGDARINTTLGYRRLDELYKSQEDFDVVVDTRARDMDMDTPGTALAESTTMKLTAKNAQVYKIKTREGFENRATAWHKYYVYRNEELIKIPLNEVVVGDKLLVQSGLGHFGKSHYPEAAYLAGALASDGNIIRRSDNHVSSSVDLFGAKKILATKLEECACSVIESTGATGRNHKAPVFKESGDGGVRMYSAGVAKALIKLGVDETNSVSIPEFVFSGDKETVVSYLSGRLALDGGVSLGAEGRNWAFYLTSTDNDSLRGIQKLLLNLGIYSRIHENPVPEDGYHIQGEGVNAVRWNHSPSWRLIVTDRESRGNLEEVVDFLPHHKEIIKTGNSLTTRRVKARHNYLASVKSIEEDGTEDVYDVTVEDGHSVIFDGVATGNCSEILQSNTPSEYNEDGTYKVVGEDISCNLGSLNIALTMDADIGKTVNTAIRALTSVSDQSSIDSVPSIRNGNDKSHAIGLGQMNLHGFLGREHIHYGSEEGLDFTNIYFYTVAYHAVRASMQIARERGETFEGFEKSKYYTGEYFDKYTDQEWVPKTDRVKELFANQHIPTQEDWEDLKADVQTYGMYNKYLQAVPPTGSISYGNNSTSSIHPIAAQIEIRKEGKLGRVYYPAPHMNEENKEYFKDAYEIGYEAVIDTYAEATQHVDQGLSLTLFFKDTATTRDINRAQIYAWKKGIKTLYYIRLRQTALEGTEVQNCVSCAL